MVHDQRLVKDDDSIEKLRNTIPDWIMRLERPLTPSTSFVVSSAATTSLVSASMPKCSFRHDRRVLVPCFSASHSPAPHNVNPVLSTSRYTGSLSAPALKRGR